MIEELIKELEREEGFRPYAYQDHLGYWTIGIGRLIDKEKGGGITQDEAEYLLTNDIKRVMQQLDARFPWWRQMTERRMRALVNMAFQLGIGGVSGFRKMLEALKAGDYERAAKEALDSKWAKEDTPARARRIAEIIKNG